MQSTTKQGLDLPGVMRKVLSGTESDNFADEWDAEARCGLPASGAPAD